MLDGSQVNQSAVAWLVKKQRGAQHPWRLLGYHPPPPLPVPPPTFITVRNPGARGQIYGGDCSLSPCARCRISHDRTGRGMTPGGREGKGGRRWEEDINLRAQGWPRIYQRLMVCGQLAVWALKGPYWAPLMRKGDVSDPKCDANPEPTPCEGAALRPLEALPKSPHRGETSAGMRARTMSI